MLGGGWGWPLISSWTWVDLLLGSWAIQSQPRLPVTGLWCLLSSVQHFGLNAFVLNPHPLQKATTAPGRKPRGRPKKLVGAHGVCWVEGWVKDALVGMKPVTHVQGYPPLQRSLVSRKAVPNFRDPLWEKRYGTPLGPQKVSCAHTPLTRDPHGKFRK